MTFNLLNEVNTRGFSWDGLLMPATPSNMSMHVRSARARANHNVPALGIASLPTWSRRQQKPRHSYASIVIENHLCTPDGLVAPRARAIMSTSDSAEDGCPSDPPKDDPPKDDPPADPPKQATGQPPQLSSEQMESLASQVTKSVLKQLAASGAKPADSRTGSSSATLPGDQGEQGADRTSSQQ
jgi:hypothetical protein